MSCLSIQWLTLLCIFVLLWIIWVILCNNVAAVPVKLKSTGHNMGIIGNFKSIIGSFCGNKRIE